MVQNVIRVAIATHTGGESIFGRTAGDTLFPLALEYSKAGATHAAIAAPREAVEAGSVYLPLALPYGSNEFPRSLRDDPRYGALWPSSGLVELMKRRSAAAKAGR